MEHHQLSPALGSRESKKRKGRGQGSGKGQTSGKGHKGAQSRSGYKTNIHLRSGSMPFHIQIPKSHFKGNHKKAPMTFKTSALVKVVEATRQENLTQAVLVDQGLVKRNKRYKILSDGPVKVKVTVHTFACSAKAKREIEARGGEVIII
jgi:large subunit ribosomal protein L15